MAVELRSRLQRAAFEGVTITLKLKYPDFIQKTRSLTVPDAITDSETILELSRGLLKDINREQSFRLVGLSVSNRKESGTEDTQMELGFPSE